MPKTTTTKAPTPADAEKQAQLDPPTDEERIAVLQTKIDALEAERDSLLLQVSMLDIADPQTRADLRAVRVAIEEAIPSSRYLSGNDVEGCKRIKDAIDKILEQQPPTAEPPAETQE
jgi:hypothetical protein